MSHYGVAMSDPAPQVDPGPNAGLSPGLPGTLQVTTTYSPWTFVYALCTPRLQLDGMGESKGPWGTSTWTVAPGPHTVRCWFTYLFITKAGDAATSIVVQPGEVVSLQYRAPFWAAFFTGRWTYQGGGAPAVATAGTVAPPPPAAVAPPPPTAPAADWYPDPSARHEVRYWDGTTWTPHVSDAGVTASDPL